MCTFLPLSEFSLVNAGRQGFEDRSKPEFHAPLDFLSIKFRFLDTLSCFVEYVFSI